MKLPIALVFTAVFYGYTLSVFDAAGLPFMHGVGILLAVAGVGSGVLAVIGHMPRATRRRYERMLLHAFSLKPMFQQIAICVSMLVIGQTFAFLITPIVACLVLAFLSVCLIVFYGIQPSTNLNPLGCFVFGVITAAIVLSVLHDPITTNVLNAVGWPASIASGMLYELPVVGQFFQPLSPDAFRSRFFVIIDWLDFSGGIKQPRRSWFGHYYHYMLTHLSPQAIVFRSSRAAGVLVYAAIQVGWWISLVFVVSLIPRLFLGTPFLLAIALKRWLHVRGTRVAVAASILTWMCVPSALWYLVSQ